MKKNVNALLALALTLTACQKQTQPIPSEDPSPARQLTRLIAQSTGAPNFSISDWKGITWGDTWNQWDLGGATGPRFATVGVNSDVDDFHNLGVHWVRLGYDAGADLNLARDVDPKVIAAVNAGMSIIMWFKKPGALGWNVTNDQQTATLNALQAAVNRYGNYIKYWELGNEVNLNSNWSAINDTVANEINSQTGQCTPTYLAAVKSYCTYATACKSIVNAAGGKLVIGGLSSWLPRYINFMKAMRQNDSLSGNHYCWNSMDEFNIHPYESGTNPTTARVIADVEANLPNTSWPVWVTEVGVQSQWPGAAYVSDANSRGKELAVDINAILSGIPAGSRRPICLYELHEGYDDSPNFGYGLVNKIFNKTTNMISETQDPHEYQNDPATTPFAEFKAITDGAAGITLVNESCELQSIGSAPDFWDVTNASGTSATVQTNSTQGHVIKLVDSNAAGTTKIHRAFTSESGYMTFEYKFLEANNNKYTRYRIMSGSTEVVTLAVVAGSLSVVNSSGYTAINGGAVTSGSWNSVKIQINTTAATPNYNLFLNSTQLLSNHTLYHNAANLNSFEVETGNSYTDVSVLVDDIYIHK